MILELNNNIKSYGHCIKNLPNMSSTAYPKQNEDLLGCTIRVRFKSEYRNVLMERYIKNETGELVNNSSSAYFMIARFDVEEPNVVILINYNGEVVITNNREIVVYDLPTVRSIPNESFPYYPKDKSSVVFYMTNYNLFEKLYKNETIHKYPIQIDNLIGHRVYIDYESDRLNGSLSYNDNKLPVIHKRPSDLKEDTPVHLQDRIDDTSRVNGNEAYIIRADKNNCYPQFVVLEKIADEEHARNYIKFVLSSEAHIYYDIYGEQVYPLSSIFKELVLNKYVYGTNVKF